MTLGNPATPALKEQARRFLCAHELTNANLLWVLEQEPGVEVVLDDEEGPGALALLLRPPTGEWQRPKFPDLRRLWLEAGDRERARAVLRRVPGAEVLYARIHREWLNQVLAERYRLEPIEELVYFRADLRGFRPRVPFLVALEEAPKPDVADLLVETGRTTAAVQALVKRCGGVYVARVAGVPVGVCCVNAKTAGVSEILALYVVEAVRRRGVGQSLVSVAAEAVRAHGRIPTYCTHHDNLASQALVRSVGFEQYQRILSAVVRPRVG
jgi:ribosomal protein S18 acetylase RimI-like enzyme